MNHDQISISLVSYLSLPLSPLLYLPEKNKVLSVTIAVNREGNINTTSWLALVLLSAPVKVKLALVAVLPGLLGVVGVLPVGRWVLKR